MKIHNFFTIMSYWYRVVPIYVLGTVIINEKKPSKRGPHWLINLRTSRQTVLCIRIRTLCFWISRIRIRNYFTDPDPSIIKQKL